MPKINFQVSAKTARLIGRENISDVDGALVELIKNAYDADASCVFVKFNLPFHSIPNRVTASKLGSFFHGQELNNILHYYDFDKDAYRLRDLTDKETEDLQRRLFSKNEIIIADNGNGMTENIIKTIWMQIGTSDKEYNVYSENGRIKTGAKGIGRFALDKLSLNTQVYTKNADDNLVSWSIDWNQFADTKLLDEIRADFSIENSDFQSRIRTLAGDEYRLLSDYSFETGTAIILSPTRDMWSERLFKKVNNNLQSIIPLTSKDTFDIIISNQYCPQYDINTKDKDIVKIDYDYCFEGIFDGKNFLKLKIIRNEIDVNIEEVIIMADDKRQYKFSINDFWERSAFSEQGFTRTDYATQIEHKIDVGKLFKDDELKALSRLGEFSFQVFFLKAGKSDLEIVKNINISKRKSFFRNFAGIKLYRDVFKVRPYGDEGTLFDWIGLGVRAQRSPAAVSHPDGSWRVEPYQVVGNVNIGRITNPFLTDMANREGLNPCVEYELMITIIENAFKQFEADRQYVLREYAKWRKEKLRHVSPTATVVESVLKQRANEKRSKRTADESDRTYEQRHSRREYEDTIVDLVNEKTNEQKTMQILMAFSSAGVMTNTFSHEISRIATDVGSRTQHLREAVKRLLGFKEYNGDEDFNPLTMIDEVEVTDNLLNSWISIIMKAVDPIYFVKGKLTLSTTIDKIVSSWTPLMEKKYISFKRMYGNENASINMAEIDLHLILNNFFLNSAWFLEDSKSDERIISIVTEIVENRNVLYLMNNGPQLDENYMSTPNIIFEAGETSKRQGTGLGLWIVREVINRYSGHVEVLAKKEGFGLKIIFNE
ncbi:MAG: ATP-binding protein [Defluviitaleaceae bacterium]|nr:ATP-binding protein [Defluviitaleaceae bacterium]